MTSKRRTACKNKALHKLGFKTGSAAVSPRDYSAGQWANSLIVCSGGGSPLYVGTPVMLALDRSQDAWMAFKNTLYWWDGHTWHSWLQTDWTYTYYQADIFSQYHDNSDWYDYSTNPVTTFDGSWHFSSVPSGYWYAVKQDFYWFPQPGTVPNGFQHATWASLDALGNVPYCYMS